MTSEKTICAIATATGGAIGIVRVSGPDAIDIADSIFSPVGVAVPLAKRKAYTLSFGNIVDGCGNVVDEVLVSVFRAPRSYTGEDSVEISCHGSAYILQKVTELLIKKGCYAAGPGEFTQRAFLNGKMDLSQAEAVADLISSTNKASHDMALSQLKGHFSNELSLLRKQLLKITSLLELEIDFSDHEDLEFADRKELRALAALIDKRITALVHSFEIGNAVKRGVPVTIVGNTNVGKSTLLNRLLHEEKAIVSDVHGTTRDFIEDTTVINGITFRFVDTAGIRHTADVVENIGIERTYKKMSEAKIILWLIDKAPSADEKKRMESYAAGKKLIVVYNKVDESVRFGNGENGADKSDCDICISAKYGYNIPDLEKLIVSAADIPQLSESDVVVTSARHYNALLHASESIRRVIEVLDMSASGDLIAEDLKMATDSLADITGEGRITSQETLNTIFKEFCIGK